jgi:hypothetical protein
MTFTDKLFVWRGALKVSANKQTNKQTNTQSQYNNQIINMKMIDQSVVCFTFTISGATLFQANTFTKPSLRVDFV